MIIDLARATLDRGLCFSRTAHITRATDAELIAFANAIIEQCASQIEVATWDFDSHSARDVADLIRALKE